ncbi:MAG: 1-acyl-sn-glycerol-3-phosphate acyltransferase [Lachnospiraceae bacterium]|nr:1-acyl-sn-glycerol-3-phosphate acyltransferase [Lachnospiraceae bacterium]
MIDNDKRFDLTRRPKRQSLLLRPITWLVSFPYLWLHRAKMNRSGVPSDLKPPYLLLCNHNSATDFRVMTKAVFPFRANYVVAIDGFIGFEWLLRAVGCFGTRKFSRNLAVVKNMFHIRNNGDIIILYPEARYSLCGTQAVLPDSLGKIIKRLNIPVVTLMMHGHHINSPFWNKGDRFVRPLKSELNLLFTAKEASELSVQEINKTLAETIVYDDFAWQKENKIKIRKRTRAEGLHKVLYQCPACLVEYQMNSYKSTLQCGACGKAWEMTALGELVAKNGETEFSHIPDWYEWERANVRREVENGTYSFESTVKVWSLPNTKGFIKFPELGHLTHNMNGFTLTGVSKSGPFTNDWPVRALYSCHIEYNYKGAGDCVDLNTNDDTLYLFPQRTDFSVTKISLATEELYTLEAKKS